MVVNFSSFNANERPTIILKNAGGLPLGILGFAKNVKIDLRYNETSQIEFELPARVDGEDTPHYDDVVGMRVIELLGIGQFTLLNPKEKNDGVVREKSCKGYSLEYEFAYKKITLDEGTYKFWSASDASGTLLGMVLEQMPSWSISYVSPTLIDRYRTFSVNNENLYNFLKGTVQESYNCLIDFDTMTREISIRDASEDAPETPVYLSTNNLISEIEIEENTEDIVTRLDVNGADGVNIRDVNPCGTNRIINLDYFMTPSNFDQTLIDKYYEWKEFVESNQQDYYNLSIEYGLIAMERATAEAALAEARNELTTLETQRGVIIQAIAQNMQKQQSLDNINARIDDQQALITEKMNNLAAIENTAKEYLEAIKSVQDECSFEGFFDEEELILLDRYIKDDEISDSSFVVATTASYEDPVSLKDAMQYMFIEDATVTVVERHNGIVMFDISGGHVFIDDALGEGNTTSAQIASGFVRIDLSSAEGSVTFHLENADFRGDHRNKMLYTCCSKAMSISNYDGEDNYPVMSTAANMTLCDDLGEVYITFDTSEYERRSVAWELYQYGRQVLQKIATPSYTFDLSTANFLSDSDFEMFKNSLHLGRKVYVSRKDGEAMAPICIGAELEYDDPASLKLLFSDSYTATDSSFRLVDLLDKSVSMGKNLDLSKYIYSSFVDSGADTGIRKFMTSALDVAKNAIQSSSGQAVSWDASGIRLRKWTDDTQTAYEDEQIWMNNNSIVMTSDNWATAQMAIGKFYDENIGGECWGIVAQRVVGTLLAGSELIIECEKKDGDTSVFRMDSDGCRLYNADFAISNGTTHIILNPEIGIAMGAYPLYKDNDKTEIDLDRAKFYVDRYGDLHFKGNIIATGLTIEEGSDAAESMDGYISSNPDVQGAADAASSAQSAANAANNAASSAQSTANAANSTANSALSTANSANSAASSAQTAATNAINQANKIYNGTTGIYFTSSSVSKFQLNTSVGLKITGKSGEYFQVKDTAMGFFKSDGTPMLYYENGNMVLKGMIAATSGYIGGENGWIIGNKCIYNNGASAFGTAGGIYLGTDGISLGNAITMAPDGSFVIRGFDGEDNDANYAFKIVPEVVAGGEIVYRLHLNNIVWDDTLIIPSSNGGTGAYGRDALGRTAGIYRVGSASLLSSIDGLRGGDIGIVYAANADDCDISSEIYWDEDIIPPYLIPGFSSMDEHCNKKYFGINGIAYWNVRDIGNEDNAAAYLANYARIGVNEAQSQSCGLFVPIEVAIDGISDDGFGEGYAVDSVVLNYLSCASPQGTSARKKAYGNPYMISLYKYDRYSDTATRVASTSFAHQTIEYGQWAMSDRWQWITMDLDAGVAFTAGIYYVVFFSRTENTYMWISPQSISLAPATTGNANGIYVYGGGEWTQIGETAIVH